MILITGGTGRIGKHLAERLLEEGESVRVLAQEKSAASEELERKGAEIFFGDLLDEKSLEIALQEVEIVYHLAAVVDYLAPKKLMRNVNVEGTKNLMEICKTMGMKKIIYLSSTAVYGKKYENPATEETPCKPSNFYGKTKMEAEKIVLEAGGIILRSADVYFPGFVEGYHSVFSMLEKGKMRIIGSGRNRIQYVYIDDLIDALLLSRKKGRAGETYNIAGGEILTQEELYGLACKHLGVEPPRKHIGTAAIKFLLGIDGIISKLKRKKPKMISEYVDKIAADRTFSIEKARNELGFRPKTGYEEGLKKTIEYYLKHKKGNTA